MSDANWFDDLASELLRWRHLGLREFPSGCRLIGHVPHVAPLAYLHHIFSPLSPDALPGLEAELGRPLPADFASFLFRSNGLNIFSDALSVYGLRFHYRRDSIDEAQCQPHHIRTPNLHERPAGAAADDLFIGGYSADGSKVAQRPDGSIYRCSRWSAAALNRWPSFRQWLESEVARLAAIFDEQGRCIASTKLPDNSGEN